MKTILITGGTGLVGQHLCNLLTKRGYEVIVLTRDIQKSEPSKGVSYAAWNIERKEIDTDALKRANFIIHLAGAGVVDKRWTKSYKKKILDSRTESIGLIIETLRKIPHQVEAIISASAIGWYGPDRHTGAFKEDEPAYNDFLGETCRLWEATVDEAGRIGIRVCKMRTGIVLSKDGGALKEFMKPVSFGIAAILGSGKQVVSWVHIDDLCRAYLHAIENKSMTGAYNVVAPYPVTNKELILKIAKQLKGQFYIPMYVPAFVLRLALGESSIEVLKSTTVSCKKISDTGFTFYFPSVEPALADNLKAS